MSRRNWSLMVAVTASLSGLVLLANSARGGEPLRQPFEYVRSLRAAHDQIVQGSINAHGLQRTFLAQIEQSLARAKPPAWSDVRNVRALVAFVLNGGAPDVLRDLLKRGIIKDSDDKFMNGVVAYGEGRNAAASGQLEAVDLRSLDAGLAGHVALIRAILTETKNPAAAIAQFDQARLLAPGTLIEEAALRREAFLLAAAGDLDRFEQLASQYFRRFPASLYGVAFRSRFVMQIVQSKYTDDPARLRRLEAVLEILAPGDRTRMFLAIAREGILQGKVQLTRMAAQHSARLAPDGSAARERAKVYEGAASIVTDDFSGGIRALNTAQRARLDQRDVELLDTALAVADRVRTPPQASAGIGGATSKIVGLAQQTIAQADALLAVKEK